MYARVTLAMPPHAGRSPHTIAACCAVALALACDSPTKPAAEEPQPPLIPEASIDQVGLPEDYATKYKAFYVFDRADNRQVRVVYANDSAAAGFPYRYGSILVMETYRARTDAQGVVLGTDGRFQRDALTGIFVMRKERWFGRRFGQHQTGEWEYASYRADKTANVVGDAAAQGCAVCHLDAGPSRDWVYRGNLHYANGSGAIPQAPAEMPANQPFVDNYTFVPATITVNRGTRITWTNRDQVKHTITSATGTFSSLVSQGASFGLTFNTAGTFEYLCAIHPAMRARVVVLP